MGWKEASRAYPAWGPPHGGATSFSGQLRQLTVPEDLPKHAHLKTHMQNTENKVVSGFN